MFFWDKIETLKTVYDIQKWLLFLNVPKWRQNKNSVLQRLNRDFRKAPSCGTKRNTDIVPCSDSVCWGSNPYTSAKEKGQFIRTVPFACFCVFMRCFAPVFRLFDCCFCSSADRFETFVRPERDTNSPNIA